MTTLTTACAGCIGRGTTGVCRVCGLPIPAHLRLGPDMPGPQPNPALDGWAFNLVLDLLDQARGGTASRIEAVPGDTA
ncbi:hypothetical protein GCM10010435_66050 [Winogradskya consettensis]|uniref:Uncharacterized protein n=1 Tax=Winogradskya consettensis TaxID=113560 RepID=A0A919T2F1_9ACTN|nr:hypothetical protein [Actinoplanes consettensis]GIM84763.1 hypothetical protein Aco04nite_93030 [Actinoplanes consettensis]